MSFCLRSFGLSPFLSGELYPAFLNASLVTCFTIRFQSTIFTLKPMSHWKSCGMCSHLSPPSSTLSTTREPFIPRSIVPFLGRLSIIKTKNQQLLALLGNTWCLYWYLLWNIFRTTRSIRSVAERKRCNLFPKSAARSR